MYHIGKLSFSMLQSQEGTGIKSSQLPTLTDVRVGKFYTRQDRNKMMQ